MPFSFRVTRGGSLRAALMLGSSLFAAVPAAAGQAPVDQVAGAAPQTPPETVVIQGQRPEDFKVDVPSLSKLTQPLVDIPQAVDIISNQELQDRATASLNDALKSVPGISLGAGEFSFQGNVPTIRGFVARTDLFLDGIRDFGNYYRDSFNLNQIEVLQGPSSVLFGRGSTGGVINQASKFPDLEETLDANVQLGSDQTRRTTLDWNKPLASLGDSAAVRINAMGHEAKVPGRDVVEVKRYGFAPSLALGFGMPTRLTAAYFHQGAEDIPDYGLPWFGSAPAPVPRKNFYGFDSDHLDTTADIGTVKVEHDLAPTLILHNQLRYGYYTRDFRISEPIITAPLNTPLDQIDVSRNIWTGDSVESMLWDQADVTAHFDTGRIQHALVAGVEGGLEKSKPNFFNSSGVPTVQLLAPDPHQPFVGTTFPRFSDDTKGTSFAAYVLDTLTFNERWEFTAALRWDYFKADYKAVRYSTTTPGLIVGTDNFVRIDRMPSYRGALVYKPERNGSIYFSYGTSFNPSAESLNLIVNARGFSTSNAFLAPEKNQTFELGTKWNVLDGALALSASVFRLEKLNARVPSVTNPGFNELSGKQRVDGFDLHATGRITERWQIDAGYTYLDSHVVDAPACAQAVPPACSAAPIGSPLINSPKNGFSVFTEYRLAQRFEVGGGANYQSSRLAQNVPPIKMVPGYWTFDAMAKFDFNENWSLQLNVNNIFDKYYFEQLHPFHVVPGAGRVALITLNFRM